MNTTIRNLFLALPIAAGAVTLAPVAAQADDGPVIVLPPPSGDPQGPVIANPTPAPRNRRPIRGSRPMASASWVTSAPTASATSAIALMKEILVARNALAATFTSSAVARSVT